MNLLVEFVNKFGFKVVSDGDLDGILASGLLILGLRALGFKPKLRDVSFPPPDKIPGLKVKNSILIELPHTKGLIYLGENLLVDHHEYFGFIWFKDKRIKVQENISMVNSIAEAIYNKFCEVIALSEDGLRVLNAVNNIDKGIYETDFDWGLHRAYRLEVSSIEMRLRLLRWIVNGDWSKIFEWSRWGNSTWIKVEDTVVRLMKSAKTLLDDIVYFTYSRDDRIESAAMREAMLKLESEHLIVLAVDCSKPEYTRVSIATKGNFDLRRIFEKVRLMGFNAGGRANVGGMQLSMSAEDALKLLRRILMEII